MLAMSATPSIQREFIGWDKPALPEAARRLAQRYRHGKQLNLGRVIVVVPGQRAGRRLQELLAFHAEDEHLQLTPPEILTEGRLPEMLYVPKLPFANDLAQDLAWARALRDLPLPSQRRIVPHPPGNAEIVRWLGLGKVLRGVHVELAADGLNFTAVRAMIPRLADQAESERWDALVLLQERYHQILDAQQLWDIQTARLKAIEFHEIGTDCDIYLLATVDLNNSLRQMLNQVCQCVTAYVVAPETLADRFDAYGCLISERWCAADIPFEDKHLRQVDGPEDQADAVTEWLAGLGGRFRTDEVAIGVPDESLVPQLQRQLAQSGLRARWVEGVRLGETAPYRLLAAAVRYAGAYRYDDVAALVRHPDLEGWLQTARAKPEADGISLPAQLDCYYNERLPSRLRSDQVHADAKHWPDLAVALKQMEGWLKDASTNRPLRQWGNVFRDLLATIYGTRTLNLDEPADAVLHRTLGSILKVCDQLTALPEPLDSATLSAADAFQVVLGPLAKTFLPPPADPEAVEILGWLELPLDDSAALIVTSFNEGFVPKSTGADAFLPDRLRKDLGLLHNERRYARDAYAASVLSQSGRELRIIFARRNTQGDPLQPSRLLFACDDDKLVGRARNFFGEPKTPAAPRRLLLAPAGKTRDQSAFVVPEPVPPFLPFDKIPVTHFKTYLACPYRYYLRHVRKLEAVDDAARELDGGAFGTLLHRVLGRFGRAPAAVRDTAKEENILEFLLGLLDEEARLWLGSGGRRPAIRLQLEMARQRLHAFSAKQAALAREGWRIIHAEKEQDGDEGRTELKMPFEVDGVSVLLVGRIDRIDFNEASKTIRILDYKTADRSQTPQETHLKNDQWIDLQLPLYGHLWRSAKLKVPPDCAVQLGYFNLPKKAEDSDITPAPWDVPLLLAADEIARDVIRKLRKNVFWPPANPPPDYSEDFAAICLDNLISGPALGDDEEGDAP
jgi:hypothetical protein